VVATTVLAAGATLRRDTLPLFRVRLTGMAPGGLDLAGGRQEQRGDTLVIRRETGAALTARYRLPARDSSVARWLSPAPLLQSDDPRVQAQARLIVAKEKDPARAARAIAAWVRDHVGRQRSGGVPSAVHALEARRGDCNEHAVLFVALARAAGLPARTAGGLVYLDGRFYYHAWAEVYLGDWVAVDPMLDQFPAGAARVRFSVGGLARQAELVPLIGRIKLEVL
jgi:transglutaminase-like putative cysteine protease